MGKAEVERAMGTQHRIQPIDIVEFLWIRTTDYDRIMYRPHLLGKVAVSTSLLMRWHTEGNGRVLKLHDRAVVASIQLLERLFGVGQ